MPVETNPAGIWELDPNYPDGSTETGATLDNYMRVRLQALLDTFPNVAGAVTPTHTELNYVDGVTSAIQTQLNAKAATSHTHASTGLTDTDALTYNADTDVSGNAWVLDEDNLASNSATKLATQQSIKAYVDAAVDGIAFSTPDFESPARSVANHLEPHGLGAKPRRWQVVLRNVTPEDGYVAGDDILLNGMFVDPSIGQYSTYANATNIGFSTSGLIRATHATTGALVVLTLTNWRLIFRAWL